VFVEKQQTKSETEAGTESETMPSQR
jgi:hypothetical protein